MEEISVWWLVGLIVGILLIIIRRNDEENINKLLLATGILIFLFVDSLDLSRYSEQMQTGKFYIGWAMLFLLFILLVGSIIQFIEKKINPKMLDKLQEFIVNKPHTLQVRKELDLMLKLRMAGKEKQIYIPGTFKTEIHTLTNILLVDDLVMFTQQTGFIVRPTASAFQGYVKEFKGILYRRILAGFWVLIAAIAIPILIKYFNG